MLFCWLSVLLLLFAIQPPSPPRCFFYILYRHALTDFNSTAVESYVKSLDQPSLLDLIVQPPSEDVAMEDVDDLRPLKRKVIYPEVHMATIVLPG